MKKNSITKKEDRSMTRKILAGEEMFNNPKMDNFCQPIIDLLCEVIRFLKPGGFLMNNEEAPMNHYLIAFFEIDYRRSLPLLYKITDEKRTIWDFNDLYEINMINFTRLFLHFDWLENELFCRNNTKKEFLAHAKLRKDAQNEIQEFITKTRAVYSYDSDFLSLQSYFSKLPYKNFPRGYKPLNNRYTI